MKNVSIWLTLLVTLTLGINLAQAGPGTKAEPVKLPAPYNTAAGGNTYTYYANSPAGKWNTAFSNASSNSGKPLRKFVDSLPGLTPAGANNLGAYIPIATKMPNPVAGDPADYYEIEVTDFNQQMHSDLPGPFNNLVPGSKGTKLRGYRDLSNNLPARYLGPLIIGTTYDPTKPANTNGNGAPVRIKFVNSLGHSNNLDGPGDLFIPVDHTAMGAGVGPDSWKVDALGKVTPSGIVDKYLQNRAELHLHGGVSPWISDGTPHQWITPAVDSATRYPKGVTQTNVPDMADPGPGAATYYYSNQQSARLMWYHDHAYGLTRLNAYVGEAAGYLLLDSAELAMIGNGTLPGVGTPLILQDKTFVPQDIAVQDAKWTNPKWGTYGDLWFPHVYEPNQNPLSLDGSNPYGRWDYGPWFWPPVQLVGQYLNLPSAGSNNDPTLTPEGYMDTALVNGTAYPYMNVEPKGYRFRILNGADDRPLNLQLYVSDPASPGNVIRVDANGNQWGAEVAMLPAAKWPTCKSNTPATPEQPLLCSCTATYSPKGCRPADWPTDGRDGGVPDPQFVGPTMVQIGTDGGILPAPVVIPNQPVSYDYNRRNIVVLDILKKSLLLAPAERADVIIDFTAFAGKTVILYNDAPSPMPAFDSRYDYYTDGPDQTPNGGAPATAAGYGPNTRTYMQFRVGTTATAPELHYKDANNVDTALMTTLDTAVKAAFVATQPTPLVPESAYNATYGTGATDVFSTIFDNALTFTPLLGGSSKTVNFQSKAIQELWDPYGRMNATLGIELPMTNNRVQTTIPYGYVDPPTELLDDNGQPILWKITHNGVDTHPVHFHLYNVQLINRVGWDGAIRPPDANELGWKETVRMKPLEDVVVAFQPVLPKLPFGIPKSQRLMDPAFPAGAVSTVNVAGAYNGDGPGFMNIDPAGNPIVVVNALQFYDHEYVWHCHILGHEENDFMRPQIINDTSIKPGAPVLTVNNGGVLTWTDATPAGNLATMGNPANEVGFRIERAGATGAFSPIYKALANSTTYTDTSALANTTYRYQVFAYNAAGDSAVSNIVTEKLTPPVVSITNPPAGAIYPLAVAIPIAASATAKSGLTINRVEFYDNGALLATDTTSPYSYIWTTAAVGTHNLTAIAYDSDGGSNTSPTVAMTVSATVSPVTITTPASLPIFTVGSLYAQKLAASGGTGTYTWSAAVVGTLPPGVNFTPGTSRLYGIPTTAGSYTFILTVSDSSGSTTSKEFTLTSPIAASMISPANNTVLTGASQTFTWNNPGADAYQVWVGTTPGSLDLGAFGPAVANGTSATATGLPVNGSTVYVRLYSLIGPSWYFNDYTYTAIKTSTSATIITPVNNAILAGSSQTFTWNDSGANAYQLWFGSSPGSLDLGVFGPAIANGTTVTATGLPVNGSTIFVRLYSKIGATWSFNDYTYSAPSAATMISPADSLIIAKAGQVFTWTNSGASTYQVWIGSTPGSLNLGVIGPSVANGTTATAPTLPANTSVYVTLYSLIDGTWFTNSYSYTTGP